MIYQYLFYRLYKRQRTKFTEIESIIFAMLTITAILFVNFFTIDIFLHKLLLTPSTFSSIAIVIIVMAVFLCLNCWLFLVNKRYRKIEQKFSNESKTHQNIGTFIIIAYIVLSFVLFFISVSFK